MHHVQGLVPISQALHRSLDNRLLLCASFFRSESCRELKAVLDGAASMSLARCLTTFKEGGPVSSQR